METRNYAAAEKRKTENVDLEELSELKVILKREGNEVKVLPPPQEVLMDKEERATIYWTYAVVRCVNKKNRSGVGDTSWAGIETSRARDPTLPEDEIKEG